MLGAGAFYALLSLRLSIWSSAGPQEGFFPLLIAALICGLSLSILVGSLAFPAPEAGVQEKVSPVPILAYAALMVLYAFLLDRIGFLATSAAFIFVVLKYVEKQSWSTALWVGPASILISYLLFVYFLGVPLPRGILR